MFGQRQPVVSSDNIKPPAMPIKLDIPKDAMIGDTPTSIVNDKHNLPG